jgi:hypothetical protein
MIANLPKAFPLDKLEQFTIGDAEPENDSLLNHDLGICKINPVLEFIRGKKSLIVGPRGAGKSTLFKLIRDRKLSFAEKKGWDNISLAIDESLDYVEIKNRVFESFHLSAGSEESKCRFFWEIYLLFRMLVFIETIIPDLPESLKKSLKNIKLILHYEDEKITILSLLKNLKLTGGLKISQTLEGASVTPHVSMEPGEASGKAASERTIKFNIESCKRELHSLLLTNKKRLFVLLDSLDEFVVKEGYISQKLFIQGLLECERSYLKYDNIRLKLFLRSDLFDRLDYEALGAEKVAARKINLVWSSQDIRRLIAQRITYNYLSLLNLHNLIVNIKKEKLYLDESSALDVEKTFQNGTFGFLTRLITKLRERDIRSGRHINFTDEISREIITSIFPRTVKHRTNQGKKDNCEFIDFCESHLSLSNSMLTPRIAIMFIEKCLECTRNYYRDNPDIVVVELDANNEYPLIKKSCITNAYEMFRDELWESFYKNMPVIWKPFLNTLRRKRGTKYEFEHKELDRMLGFNDHQQFQQFVAFLCHIGILENAEGIYKLPVVFRQ